MPPSRLYFSMSHSAAFFAGIPKTVAGPERKDTMPTFSSAGLAWAPAGGGAGRRAASATAAAQARSANPLGSLLRYASRILMATPPLPAFGMVFAAAAGNAGRG